MYILLILLLSSCSHMSSEQMYYYRIYKSMCDYRMDISTEDGRRQQEYYDRMCQYADTLK